MPNEMRDTITYPFPPATATCWGLGIGTQFFYTPYDGCNYLHMLGYYEIDLRCLFLDLIDVVNIGSDSCLVPSRNKSLHVPTLTNNYVVKWRH